MQFKYGKLLQKIFLCIEKVVHHYMRTYQSIPFSTSHYYCNNMKNSRYLAFYYHDIRWAYKVQSLTLTKMANQNCCLQVDNPTLIQKSIQS